MTAENEEKDIKGVNKDASNKDTDISDEEMERDDCTKSIKVQAFGPPAQEFGECSQKFGPGTQEELEPKKLEPKGFLQVLEDEERKRTKREQQEINFILPQNF